MESCLKEVIWTFWSERNLINCSQFGFVPQSSCTSQLLEYLEDVTSAINENQLVDVAYLYFSKAFNTVPHQRLLMKLSALGVKGNMLKWICSFLSDRKEVVIVDGVKSKPRIMKSGVPQGSCLGPLVFIAYVNNMNFCLDYCKIVKYADDVKAYKVMSKNDSAQQSRVMQSDLTNFKTGLTNGNFPSIFPSALCYIMDMVIPAMTSSLITIQ